MVQQVGARAADAGRVLSGRDVLSARSCSPSPWPRCSSTWTAARRALPWPTPASESLATQTTSPTSYAIWRRPPSCTDVSSLVVNVAKSGVLAAGTWDKQQDEGMPDLQVKVTFRSLCRMCCLIGVSSGGLHTSTRPREATVAWGATGDHLAVVALPFCEGMGSALGRLAALYQFSAASA